MDTLQWTMDRGHWIMDIGQKPLEENDPESLDKRQFTVDKEHWTMDIVQWSLDGQRTVDKGHEHTHTGL